MEGYSSNQLRWKTIVVQSLSCVQPFVTPWTAACQASLSFIIFQSLLKLMSIKSVMPSNHLILCCPFLLLRSIFHSIRVFSNELALCIRWPKNWSISFSISPSTDGRKWQSTLVFLLGKSNGEKSLVGYSPCGCKEWDTTEWLSMHHIIYTHTHTHMCVCIYICVCTYIYIYLAP